MKRVYCTLASIISLIVLIAPGSFSQQDTLSLDKAIRMGLENNFSIKIARNDQRIARNNNTAGNAGMLPRADASIGFNTRMQSINQTPRGGANESSDRTTSTLSGSVALSWTLFDGMAMFVSRDQLRNLQSMDDLKYRMSVEDAVASIIVNYYSIVQQQKLINSLKESFALSKERLKVTREKSKIGVGYELQVIQAEVDLRADSSNLLRQVNYLKNLMVDLNRTLGREPGTQFEVNPLEINVSAIDYERIYNGMTNSNAELLYERMMLNNRELNVRLQEANRYPRLSLAGSYDLSSIDYSSGSTEKYRAVGPYLGITASMTLFNGFNVSRNIANARIQLENEQITLLQKENTLKSLAIKYYNDYNLAFSLVKTEEIAMNLAHKNFIVAMEKYRLGAISDLELREIQKKMLDAQYRFYNAQLQAKTAEVELQVLAGMLVSAM